MSYVDSSGKKHVSLSEAASGYTAQHTASRDSAGNVVGNSPGSRYAREQAMQGHVQDEPGRQGVQRVDMPTSNNMPNEIENAENSRSTTKRTISLHDAATGHAARTTASRNARGEIVGNSQGSRYTRQQEASHQSTSGDSNVIQRGNFFYDSIAKSGEYARAIQEANKNDSGVLTVIINPAMETTRRAQKEGIPVTYDGKEYVINASGPQADVYKSRISTIQNEVSAESADGWSKSLYGDTSVQKSGVFGFFGKEFEYADKKLNKLTGLLPDIRTEQGQAVVNNVWNQNPIGMQIDYGSRVLGDLANRTESPTAKSVSAGSSGVFSGVNVGIKNFMVDEYSTFRDTPASYIGETVLLNKAAGYAFGVGSKVLEKGMSKGYSLLGDAAGRFGSETGETALKGLSGHAGLQVQAGMAGVLVGTVTGETSKSYQESGTAGATQSLFDTGLALAIGAGPYMRGSNDVVKVGDMWRTRGLKELPAENIVNSEVLSGKLEIPLTSPKSTAGDVINTFRAEDGAFKGWHSTGTEFADKTVSLDRLNPAHKTDVPGTYLSPEQVGASAHFTRTVSESNNPFPLLFEGVKDVGIGVKNWNTKQIDRGLDSMITSFAGTPEPNRPAILHIELPGAVERLPVDIRVGMDRGNIEAARAFYRSETGTGRTFLTPKLETGILGGGRAEAEAVITPGTDLMKIKDVGWIRSQHGERRIKISEYEAKPASDSKLSISSVIEGKIKEPNAGEVLKAGDLNRVYDYGKYEGERGLLSKPGKYSSPSRPSKPVTSDIISNMIGLSTGLVVSSGVESTYTKSNMRTNLSTSTPKSRESAVVSGISLSGIQTEVGKSQLSEISVPNIMNHSFKNVFPDIKQSHTIAIKQVQIPAVFRDQDDNAEAKKKKKKPELESDKFGKKKKRIWNQFGSFAQFNKAMRKVDNNPKLKIVNDNKKGKKTEKSLMSRLKW